MNDFNKVVGLKYEVGEGLPKVIVKGSGKIAEAIIDKSKTINGPKIIESKELVDKLYRLPIDADISEDLFEMVAMILAHVIAVNEKDKGGSNG